MRCARVAQWIRALVFGTRCREFESLRGYQALKQAKHLTIYSFAFSLIIASL
jgi:hypothetical protein